MPDMNSTSASLYGSRPRPGGVGWRPEDGARAHPLPNAAAASHVASARREIVAIRRSQGRIVVDPAVCHRVQVMRADLLASMLLRRFRDADVRRRRWTSDFRH